MTDDKFEENILKVPEFARSGFQRKKLSQRRQEQSSAEDGNQIVCCKLVFVVKSTNWRHAFQPLIYFEVSDDLDEGGSEEDIREFL